jgi:hypothetical protein
MQISERQASEVREITETEDRTDLRRAAHKIFWKRMNGSINAANPFAEVDPDSVVLEGTGGTNRSSRHL